MEGAEAHWLLVVSLGKLPVASLISPIRAWGASQTWGATTSTDPNWNWSENWAHWSSSTVSVPLSCCIHKDWYQWTWISIPLVLVLFDFWRFRIVGYQPESICVCVFVYVILLVLVLSPLLSFREKDEWMEGDDWRLLKYWLFRGFGRAKH